MNSGRVGFGNDTRIAWSRCSPSCLQAAMMAYHENGPEFVPDFDVRVSRLGLRAFPLLA